MSRAETLAGLTEAIAPHDDWRFHSDEAWSCRCGEPLIVPEGLVRPVHRAHVAAVALAWLEGHGWAEGDEEWGARIETRPGFWYDQKHSSEGSARWYIERAGSDATLIRRRVTPWASVETGDAPDA